MEGWSWFGRQNVPHFTIRSVQVCSEASTLETAVLDGIVARDPERYLAWLSSLGYFDFTSNEHN